jgi:hypothetical protein
VLALRSNDRSGLRRYGTWLPAAVLLGAVVVFWWPCLFGRMCPLLGDAQSHMRPWRSPDAPPTNARWDILLWDGVAQYYPWRTFAARAAKHGLIPLWNPHQFCGTPFVANGQSAFFYPPNWLFVLFDARYVFGLSAALHYLLAGAFMVLLARELGLSAKAGLVGAAAFAFGGFMVSWTELPTLMNSAAWLPGVVWSVERTFRRRRPTNAVLIALTLAMSVLAGHLQIAAYVWLVAGAHLLARCGLALYRRRLRAVVLAAGMFPVAIGLASIQLLPTFELAGLSLRGGATPDEGGFEFRKARALQWRMLPTLVSPDALGSPEQWSLASPVAYSETCGYVGKLTLLLALFALAGIRSSRTLFLVGLAAVALLTAMGGATARLLYYCVPGMAQAGGFGRVLCVYTFAVAMLAALGAQRLMDWFSAARADSRTLVRLAPWIGVLSVAVTFVDVGTWGRRFLPLSPRDSVYPPLETVVPLQRDAGRWRALAVTPRDEWTIHRLPGALLPPNSATAYGYDSVQGYDSLVPREFGAYAAEVTAGYYTPAANGNMVLMDTFSALALGQAAVKWVLMSEGQPHPGEGFVEVSASRGVVVYRNLRAARRVRVVTARTGPPQPAVSLLPGEDPCRLACRLADPGEGYLVVADTLYPGWVGYVDGERQPLWLCAPMFRAVGVRSASREVEMVYQPASFATGMFVTLLATGAIAAWLVWTVGGGKRPGRVGRSDEPVVHEESDVEGSGTTHDADG